MKITHEKVAAITYKLSVSSPSIPKKLMEEVTEKSPMYFLVGHSGLPEKFEENLEGLTKGSDFDFSIRALDAFGEFDENEIMNLPLEEFLDKNGILNREIFQVGKLIPMTDEHGHHVRGRIIEINETNKYIRMDFNHPLAGKDLHFTGKVVEVRDATKTEMEHGHVHGPGGHHH